MNIKKFVSLSIISCIAVNLTACNLVGDGKKIIRVAHSQSETHPDHIGLLAFEKYVEDRLGDKYDVQIFPNELLGPSVKAIELTQTGAIDFTVCSTANLETFDDIYQVFSMPYLFDSVEHYHTIMENDELMSTIYKSTEAAGFEAVTWFDAGTRNFYTTKRMINKPEDLKGLKIRVQANPTNIRMMQLLGASATPMSFGEVYTALQQHVIDGAENNELALTNNKHGEVAKYYSYNQHQMVPDLLIGSLKFLNKLPPEERQIFDEAVKVCTEVERENWDSTVEDAINQSLEMGVEFAHPDIQLFKERVLPLHQELIDANPKLKPIYDVIQQTGQDLKEGE